MCSLSGINVLSLADGVHSGCCHSPRSRYELNISLAYQSAPGDMAALLFKVNFMPSIAFATISVSSVLEVQLVILSF